MLINNFKISRAKSVTSRIFSFIIYKDMVIYLTIIFPDILYCICIVYIKVQQHLQETYSNCILHHTITDGNLITPLVSCVFVKKIRNSDPLSNVMSQSCVFVQSVMNLLLEETLIYLMPFNMPVFGIHFLDVEICMYKVPKSIKGST